MPFRKTGVTPARSSPPPHCGGLQLARGSFRPPPSANSGPADPKFAPKISKNPPKTRKYKKSMQIVVRYNYLYYFWGKRSVERRESHCCLVNLEIYSPTAIRGCPVGSLPRPIGKYIKHCAMTGVGLLYYEVTGSRTFGIVMQVRLYAGLSLKSGSRFVFCRFYTGRITKRKKVMLPLQKRTVPP